MFSALLCPSILCAGSSARSSAPPPARHDDFQTRDCELVLSAILHLLPPQAHIWEPFAGTGARRLATALEHSGFTVTATGLPEQDFWDMEVPPGVTMVVSNPPFDQRTAILARLNVLGLGYCLLMPMNTLETDWPSDLQSALAALPDGHAFTVPDVLFAKITDDQREDWATRFAGTRS